MSAARQRQLHDVGAFGAEAGFAVAEVEPPQPPEPLVEAQAADVLPGRLEASAPLVQGVGVVLAEADDVAPLQARAVGLFLEAPLRRQHAAREDVLLDEVGAAA